jgi:hypothetical protein
MADPSTAIITNDIALNTPFVGLKIPTPLRNQRGIVDHPCEKAHRARHPNFLEPCQGKLLRISLPRTPVNKPPADVPEANGWHHACAGPLHKRELARRRLRVDPAEHCLGPPVPSGTSRSRPGRDGSDDGSRSLGDFLMEELYSFVGEGWEQEDDITLLTLRRS